MNSPPEIEIINVSQVYTLSRKKMQARILLARRILLLLQVGSTTGCTEVVCFLWVLCKFLALKANMPIVFAWKTSPHIWRLPNTKQEK